MKSLNAFKAFMKSGDAPNCLVRYCRHLDKYGWLWFYEQMKEPAEFVKDIQYLFYILKWILKTDFDDLSYAVYVQYVMDSEMVYDDPIKDVWLGILQKRYGKIMEEEIISSLIYDSLCPEIDERYSSLNTIEDTLPF